MKKIAGVLVLLALAMFASFGPPAMAQPAAPELNLYLRRATFDPLRDTPPAGAIARSATTSRLLLLQFDAPPVPETRAALVAAGFRPLLYIPTNGLLVRAADARPATRSALPRLRWSGPFEAAYKLSPDLDQVINGQVSGTLDVQVVATPDADVDALARDLVGLGGVLINRADGLNGAKLHTRIPAASLRALLDRDDVIWVEQWFVPQVRNDRARTILGVTAARQQLGWLNGAGQVIAIADTGLDVQQTVAANGNPDFAADRVTAAFTPEQMSPLCAGKPGSTNWTDRNGHGTHVTGSALGGGRPQMTPSLAGIAPAARVVVEAVSSGGNMLDCLLSDSSFLSKAYDAGARVQNASWGGQTGGSSFSPEFGGYTSFEETIDDYLWEHKDHLLVVAAGNNGSDTLPRDGVIDPDSINSPGTAKNVLTVGASENHRPPTGSTCASFGSGRPVENQCYTSYIAAPLATDFVSNNASGLASFSSRGPADDGRIKPEIVAPGTNIVSAASHSPDAFYGFGKYDVNYAYDSGSSMSTPMISGMAALVRQWLAQARQTTEPSAALVKALLLNGARDLSPGQYGTGSQREIPSTWPNTAEGWGRAAITETIGLGGTQDIWFADHKAGLLPGAVSTYTMTIESGHPLRISLAWTDFPASPVAGRALVNDLDLEVQPPSGPLLRGNASAALVSSCRSANGGDRCNNVESVEVAAPQAGTYTVRVRGVVVPQGPQPYALVARAHSIGDASLGVPTLEPIAGGGPVLTLAWSAVAGVASYQVVESAEADLNDIRRTFSTTSNSLTVLEDIGSYAFRVRACVPDRCGSASNLQVATVTNPPRRAYLPVAAN